MAKIKNLEVGTIKIKDGALTTFYGPAYASTPLTVTLASPNPTKLFVEAAGSSVGDYVRVTRTRATVTTVVGLAGPAAYPNGQNIRSLVIDPDPQDGDQYEAEGYYISAVVDWR